MADIKTDVHEDVKALLEGRTSSYVLITCDNEDKKGEMQVQMSYEGDPGLISYLLKGAKSYVDKE